jgi:hypothetical protein
MGVGFFLPFCIWGQQGDTNLSPDEMNQDLDSLISILKASHPYPMGYADPLKWGKAVQMAHDSCNIGARSKLEFALIVGRLLQTMQDSHTQVNIKGLWNQHLNNDYRIVPLKKIGNRLSKDPLHRIPLGSELLAFNGIALQTILDKTAPLDLMEHDSHDGRLRQQDELLPVYYSVFYLQQQDSIQIKYKDLSGAVKSTWYPTWDKRDKERYQKKNKALYDDLPKIEFHRDTAYIAIASFAPQKMGKQNRMIHSFFKQCSQKKIKHLVIDLRDNTGGKSTEVEYLMSFILNEGYNAPDNIIAKRSLLADSRIKPLNKKLVRTFLKIMLRRNEDIQRYIDLIELQQGEVDTLYFSKKIQQKKWIFQGEKHLWVNGLSASASVDFTQAWKKNNLGTIWGQCIMGNNSGTFGNAALVTLPASQLPISVATIRYNYSGDFKFETPNICPDIRIEHTIENIIHGSDPYWSAFRKKI